MHGFCSNMTDNPMLFEPKSEMMKREDNECSEFTAVSVNGLEMMTAVSGNKSMKP